MPITSTSNTGVSGASGVTLVLNSANAKLGTGVAATYVSQESCPKTCPFLEESCYAEYGPTGIHTRRLNKSTMSAEQLASAEAIAINRASFGRGNPGRLMGTNKPLRLHVVGDSRTVRAVRIVADSVRLWLDCIGSVWTYTHAWRKVARKHWGTVSVLASCEDAHAVNAAMRRGYAAALVVSEHSSDQAYLTTGGYKLIPCPNQTRGVTCTQCKLCWKDQWLLSTRSVIAFAAHGSRKNTVKQTLISIQNGK